MDKIKEDLETKNGEILQIMKDHASIGRRHGIGLSCKKHILINC